MTRGTAILILNDCICSHDEFNGGMYLDNGALGSKMFDVLSKRCTDKASYEAEMKAFNAKYHKYEDFEVHSFKRDVFFEPDRITIDFSNDYFGRFFSDYIFVKNASVDTIRVVTNNEEKKVYEILPGSTAVFHYGDEMVKKSNGVNLL